MFYPNRGDDTIMMSTDGTGDSMTFEGTWYNPDDGDSFTVRDTYIEGDNMYVMATDGRRFDIDLLSRYVKSDIPIPKKPKIDPNQPKTPASMLDKPAQKQSKVDDDLEAEAATLLKGMKPAQQLDMATSIIDVPQPQLIGYGQPAEGTTGFLSNPVSQVSPVQVSLDEDWVLINRALKRVEQPDVLFNIRWPKFPARQLDMLDMMCVDEDKIINYIIDKLDIDEIRDNIAETIRNYIHKQMEVIRVKEVVDEVKPKPVKVEKPITVEKPVKETKTKTKKK